jgi:hypothetical protein
MPIQRPLRVPGFGRDLIDAGLLIAPLGEHSQSGGQKLFPGLPLLGARGSGSAVETRGVATTYSSAAGASGSGGFRPGGFGSGHLW